MSGIQISGLLTNSAFDWKSVVDQLIAAETIPVTNLQAEQTKNTEKITALNDLKTKLQTLQDSLQSIRSNDIFKARTVGTDTSGTTWRSTSSSGAPVGSYTFAVSQLATAAQITGASNIGGSLSSSSNVSGLTIANLRTATAVTAGTFSVNGQSVSVATTSSLQDVFDAIATATSGAVTASYDSASDKVTLTGTGTITLGASNDTSNFLSAFKLSNNSSSTVTSSATLGTVKTTATLTDAGLATTPSGSGSFSINGVSISYSTSSDTLTSVISRINKSSAGVTASYDSVNDRMTLVNTSTGDVGLGVTDSSSGFLAALGLTTASGSTFTRGQNALFTVNGGETITSTTNTLDETAHGITGLSVKVNTATTQTIQIESDTSSMQTYLETFLTAFNDVQDYISTNTKITITGTNVSTSVLSDNREVDSWATKLRSLTFGAVSGLSGSIDQLDDLGFDFDGTSDQLVLEDSEKLATALSDSPDDVEAFFLTASTGFVARMYNYLTTIKKVDSTQQDNLTQANTDLQEQIDTMNARLEEQRTQLTNSFIAMLDAQSEAESANTTLTNAFFKNSSSS